MHNATIADVAKAAGVSTFTVSRALRGKEHVASKTREKVIAAAQELNYVPSTSASSLASGKTKRIALLSRDSLSGWFIGELLDGLYDVLRPEDYDITVYRAGNEQERSAFFDRLPTNKNADALIVTGFSTTRQESEVLAKMEVPILCVNSPNFESAQGLIAIDDEKAEAEVVRYLASIGHRRFAYVGRTDPLTGSQWGYDLRSHGYQDAIAELGLTNCGKFFVDSSVEDSARKTVSSILSLPEPPTAICVWSDYYALRILHELRLAGVRVPQDISVFGFDGSDVASDIGLSTVSQPARDMGRLAASMALKLINQQPLSDAQIIIPVTMRAGETSAPGRNDAALPDSLS